MNWFRAADWMVDYFRVSNAATGEWYHFDCRVWFSRRCSCGLTGHGGGVH